MIRGLQQGDKAWQALLQHRVNTFQPARVGKWPEGANWLMTATKIKPAGSLLWGAVWRSWCSVRVGVMQVEPQTMEELMRQPLFNNPWITDPEGIPRGLEKSNSFVNWAIKCLRCIQDIWSIDANAWRPTLDLLRTTKSWKTNKQRTALITSIPKNPGQALPPGEGQWITLQNHGYSEQVHYLTSITGDRRSRETYHPNPLTHELTKHDTEEIPEGRAHHVQVLHRHKNQTTGYNPPHPIPPDSTLWLHHPCRVADLTWEPGEWRWALFG